MKKFRIAALMAVLVSVLCLTGCKELFDAIKERTYDTWFEKEISYGDGKTLGCYCYYSENPTTFKGEDFDAGLTMILQAEGDSVKLFDEELTSGKYYVIKHWNKNSVVEEAGSEGGKSFKINGTNWSLISLAFNEGKPDALTDSDWKKPAEALDVSFWSEFFVDKFLDIIGF